MRGSEYTRRKISGKRASLGPFHLGRAEKQLRHQSAGAEQTANDAVVMPHAAAHATASAHHPYRGAQREHGVQETVCLIPSPMMQCHDAGVKSIGNF